MAVTLDVSRLSDWLKADALCGVGGGVGSGDCGPGEGSSVGRGETKSVRGSRWRLEHAQSAPETCRSCL
eukprot:scaffold145254_cov105-Phaeocystis_antarctica.AAC.2